MKYDRILVFTKNGNLLDYLNTDKVMRSFSNANHEGLKESYGKERKIQLIARFRWEDFPVSTIKGIVRMPKCFCNIKCPVNPLPVKGEFEVPSMDSMRAFLKVNGWELKQDVSSEWFK